MEERSELPEEPVDDGLPEFTSAVIDANGEVVPDDEPLDLAGVLGFLGIDQQELETDILAMSWDNFVQLAGDRAPEVAIERYRKLQEEGDGSV